jgi:hypothetical protein
MNILFSLNRTVHARLPMTFEALIKDFQRQGRQKLDPQILFFRWYICGRWLRLHNGLDESRVHKRIAARTVGNGPSDCAVRGFSLADITLDSR